MTGFSALAASEDVTAPMQWHGTSKVLGPRLIKMPVLTIGMLGLQIIWSVEMSYASPYLLSLGMSKSLMSIVFLAGPLSGLIVQPLIGVLSDRSQSRFGRRRPYILFGAFISFAAMYLLGFTREFASILTMRGSSANDALTIGLAVWSIYCIDFSINAVQAMDRALLVDILPVSEQEKGNAWAGRMFGLGSVLGFFVGNIDLTLSLQFLGNTQLEILCVITSCILLVTHLVTVFNVKERVVVTEGPKVKFSLWHMIKDIWRNFFALPGTIKRICLIQLFAWIGWFPVLFWTSLYVGELHKRNSPIPETAAARAILNSEATRLGSRALLCNALTSLFGSIVCPFFVSSANSTSSGRRYTNHDEYEGKWMGGLKRQWEGRPTCHLATLWAASHGTFAVCMLSTFLIRNVSAATIVMALTGFSWAITQWAPFALIAEAIHTASFDPSTQYVLGNSEDDSDDETTSIPLRDARTTRASDEIPLGDTDEGRRLIFEAKDEEGENNAIDHGTAAHPKRVHFEISGSGSRTSNDAVPSPSTLLGMNPDAQQSQAEIHFGETGNNSNPHVDDPGRGDHVGISIESTRSNSSKGNRSIEDKAGIILGIHNVFIVIPQFIITGLSSIIFAIMDPDKLDVSSHGGPANSEPPSGGPTDNSTARNILIPAHNTLSPRAAGEAGVGSADSVGVIFRIGGVSVAVACILCLQLARELKRARR